MDFFRAVPLERVGPKDVGILGSRPIQYPEEEDVAVALFRLGYSCQYETVMLRETIVTDEGETKVRGATSDYLLDDLDVFIEVKRTANANLNRSGRPRSNKGRQRRLALEAGYGFAVVFRLHYNPESLQRKVEAAVRRAVMMRDIARARFPDWQRKRQMQQVVHNFLMLPTKRLELTAA